MDEPLRDQGSCTNNITNLVPLYVAQQVTCVHFVSCGKAGVHCVDRVQNILDSQIPDNVPIEVPQLQQVLLIAVKWKGVDDSTVNALE